jgi:hypothetical protein
MAVHAKDDEVTSTETIKKAIGVLVIITLLQILCIIKIYFSDISVNSKAFSCAFLVN